MFSRYKTCFSGVVSSLNGGSYAIWPTRIAVVDLSFWLMEAVFLERYLLFGLCLTFIQ